MKELLFSTGARDPWCPGCGHSPVSRSLQHALERKYQPHEVVLVTDIGCIGMADALFSCHTVHGLHGRAPALAGGIALSRDAHVKKVVALMGDGGAAIGLQHILECARLNVDLTLIVANNQNYGMTGGQHSANTLTGVKTTTTPQGSEVSPFPLVELLAPLGVFCARTLAPGPTLGQILDQALAHPGFALVETLNWCPSYAGKLNPETLTPKAMGDFFASQGLPLGLWPATTDKVPFHFTARPGFKAASAIPTSHEHHLTGTVRLLIAGSAGEGVQSAAEVFAQAAVRSGLEVVVRGEYPVTVGKGFSSTFLLLSAEPILSPATASWDVGLVISDDGLRWCQPRLGRITELVHDASLELPQPPAGEAHAVDFRRFGAREAAFAALVWLLARKGWFPEAALAEAVEALPGAKARESLKKVLVAAVSAAG